MESNTSVIQSTRLDLVLLQPEALRLSLDHDAAALERLLDLHFPSDWYEQRPLLDIRRQQLHADPAYQPWSLRAISLREQRQVVGVIGFHTAPGPAYLQPYAPGGVEFGYTIFSPFRRRGIATEACRALVEWAHQQRGVSQFVVTISPDNIPSLRIARRLGFTRVGSHVDPDDGPEDIFRLDLDYPIAAS